MIYSEKQLINIIKSTLNSVYIGDDCAYLRNLGIVVTQDSLVEDVHFSLDFMTPYQLGYKSMMVNISDVCASGAEPVYLTVSLSLPKNIENNFVEEFYKGAKDALQGAQIVGGDITGSDKVYVSVTAIGKTQGRWISSRSNAKDGYKIIVSGEHGNSAKGLELLLNSGEGAKFIRTHLMPEAQREFSKKIAENINTDYAMMDTSDGLADALMQIAKSSGVKISVETDKIPHDLSVEIDKVLYGGEDYQLVAAVPQEFLEKCGLEKCGDFCYTIIGDVKSSDEAGLEIDGIFYKDIEDKLFNHFKG